jgi:hypothetical protein
MLMFCLLLPRCVALYATACWQLLTLPPSPAQVAAAGFTISPLLPEYRSAGGPEECLVTFVIKVDLAGWLAGGGLVSRALRPAVRWALPEPIVSSVVVMRDKVREWGAWGPGRGGEENLEKSPFIRSVLPWGRCSPVGTHSSNASK